jgi:lipopolysaccharide heptosyltransferase II
MQKILVLHTAFIGDIILATPLIPAIKNAFPDCLIDFMTIPASANLLEKETDINQLIIFDKRGKHKGFKGLKSIIRLVSENQYDACICPHRSLRSAIISKYSKAKIRVGFNNSGWKWAFTNIVNYNQSFHETQRNLSLLQEIGINSTQTRPVIKDNEEDRLFVDSLLKEQQIENKKLFAIAPGSVWPTKRWGKEKYINLVKQILKTDYIPILLGGEKDIALCNEIITICTDAISFAGNISLRQTKYLLSKCKGIVSNDSAPLHLGLAANIPVFSVFGPTIKEFGFAPIESNSYVIENENINCRPCGIHGSYNCPTKTFDCMEQINTELVMKKILQHLN